MPQIHFGLHTREIREEDASVDPHHQDDPDVTAKAADAFKVFLQSFVSKTPNPKRFAVSGYAALWCLDPASFAGRSQRQLARELGVSHEVFNRRAAEWARRFGFIGPKMRPRASTLANARRVHGKRAG